MTPLNIKNTEEYPSDNHLPSWLNHQLLAVTNLQKYCHFSHKQRGHCAVVKTYVSADQRKQLCYAAVS